jgi:hypothetical protein
MPIAREAGATNHSDSLSTGRMIEAPNVCQHQLGEESDSCALPQ